MRETLNVLYQSDNNYAPQTGVSVVSLLENNQHFDDIQIFVLSDHIAKENIDRLQLACGTYGRTLHVIDADDILQELLSLNVTPFRGGYTTYFKLLAIDRIQTNNGLLLQIDGDTIINDPLDGLFDIDLTGKICAATYECVQNEYKQLIGLEPHDYYYNCGVLWINQRFWRDFGCRDKIVNHLLNARSRYFTVDQDIINVLFGDKIVYLDIAYNVNSGFYVYGIDESYYIYDLDPAYYVEKSDVQRAVASPHINHCMGPMTGRPWEQDNFHPQGALYDKYLAMSPWHDVPKIVVKRSRLFKMQKAMYLMLPRAIYARVHKVALKRFLRQMDKKSRMGTL